MAIAYKQAALTAQQKPKPSDFKLGNSFSTRLFLKIAAFSPGSINYKIIKAGQLCYREGARCEALYVVCRGYLKLKRTTASGEEMLVTVASPGDLIGEFSLAGAENAGQAPIGYGAFNNSAAMNNEVLYHRNSALATEDTVIAAIHPDDFDMLVRHDSEAAYLFAMWMVQREQISQSKLRDTLSVPKQTALASYLLRLSNSFGFPVATGTRIQVKLTHAELGELIGATRESVNRMLHAFKEQGIIGASRGYLIIEKEDKLKELTGCPECPACPVAICRV